MEEESVEVLDGEYLLKVEKGGTRLGAYLLAGFGWAGHVNAPVFSVCPLS